MMMTYAKNVLRRSRSFLSDTSGTGTVEAAIILPALAAWFVGSYAFFDAFYERSAATKAAYTISDVLSRRTAEATPDYIDALGDLYGRLSPADGGTALRVSNIAWDGTAHNVLWSHGTSSQVAPIDNDDLIVSNYGARIPVMYPGETIVLVEAYSAYRQPFNVGWTDSEYVFEEFVVTSPRYAAQLAWNPTVNP